MTETSRTSPARRPKGLARAKQSRRQRKTGLTRQVGLGRKASSTRDAASLARGLPRDEAVALFDKQIKTFAAARAQILDPELETAIEHVGPSPSVAAGKAAAQQLLEQLNRDRRTRLMSSTDMAAYANRHRNWPAEAARRKSLICIEHAGRTLYPAFQIDPVTHKLRPWVPILAKALDEIGIDGRAFAVWSATASENFEGERPADHAGDEDFLSKAASELAEA